MKKLKFIKDLKKINKNDILLAGGKAVNLGELMKIEIPIPPGFVILTSAFEKVIEKTRIKMRINSKWRGNIKVTKKDLEMYKNLILNIEIPKEVKKEILIAFKKLKVKYVAVRSSAIVEDSRTNSWAGQLETYLNTTEKNLLQNIKKCWASVFTSRVFVYQFQKKLRHKLPLIAVIIQKMIYPRISGICFTVHPITKIKDQMIIEAVFGLGESLTRGLIAPDTYIIDKANWRILNINVKKQTKMFIGNKIGTKEVMVPKSSQIKQKLSEVEIIKLAKLCTKIENYFKCPQDIEWALEKNKFFILQSRPITTL